jgi:hypothetical protein
VGILSTKTVLVEKDNVVNADSICEISFKEKKDMLKASMIRQNFLRRYNKGKRVVSKLLLSFWVEVCSKIND